MRLSPYFPDPKRYPAAFLTVSTNFQKNHPSGIMPIFCPKTSFFFDGLMLKNTEEFRFVRRARGAV